jgi:hypothetical protein
MQVPYKSRTGPGHAPGRSWSNPDMVRQFENEMLKIGNWFTVFKTVNHFPKIKEEFSVKGKCFPLTIILRLSKHRKIRKSFS